MEQKISIIIKTFERPKSLKKLLLSIRNTGYSFPIIIVDDSKVDSGKEIKELFPDLNIKYIPIAFDSGLSKGRNVLLSMLTTPYFLLCDDDFVLDKRSDVGKAFNCIVENNFDIVGGDFYNYVTVSNLKRLVKLIVSEPKKLKRYIFNQYETSRYIGNFVINADECKLLISHKKPITSPHRCDIVNNFFIANTESIRKIGGWDDELKLGEHEDFFLRAKQNGLNVAYLDGFGTGHFPIIKSNYKKFRFRASQYKTIFAKKHNFKYYSEILVDNNVVLFEIK
ncbi:glycosyltransferase family 2 protein [Aurantibacillus circumpalustris]|uniref:glycosyltransferase family 2 protein n=1 Tax=Aurantibacillus circumpalustris TaxID=3036359 RepID=UPI00295BB236|nr:glycosyltransferase family 2 protein [Aurantibacillus circumpalustris]